MAETQGWIAFLDDLNTLAHHKITSQPNTIPFTTTNVFQSMLAGDGRMDPVVRLVKSLRLEFQGFTYILDEAGLQQASGTDSDDDVTGPLRATASALLKEFVRKEKLLTEELGKKRGAILTLTPRMVRKGFVAFMDGESQVLAWRAISHKTRYFAAKGARYPILPDWQATNDFFLCCSIKNNGSPETFYLLTDDLRRPFRNAHTGGGIPCLGTAKQALDKSDPSPWEAVFDSALAALEVINFSSLNDWRAMDADRAEHKVIMAAREAPGWPVRDAEELASMIRRGGLPFCDPGAVPVEGWG
jgi:hypothetical protein